MRLDRNITNPRRGKYALIKLRLSDLTPDKCLPSCDTVPVETNAIDFGDSQDTDFFVIRLKDRFAAPALEAYAMAAFKAGETEYATDVLRLAFEAKNHPLKTTPD